MQLRYLELVVRKPGRASGSEVCMSALERVTSEYLNCSD